jgi:adenylate kinase
MFGAPGSGKGTHGKILGTIPGFYHLSCGDLFRGLSPESPLGKVFVDYSSQGKLVPDKLTIQLWKTHTQGLTAAGRLDYKRNTLVLDGLPRNVRQAEMLKKYLDVVAVFYMCSANFDNLVKRLQRRALKDNRLDDANLDVIKARLKTYEDETKPVLNYYGKGIVHRINTDGTPPQTFFKVLKQVVKLPEI